MWVILQNCKTECNYFNVISVISTPLLLIEKSKLTYPFLIKYQQVIGTNLNIYTKGFNRYYYL